MKFIIQEKQTYLNFYNVWFDLYNSDDLDTCINMVQALYKKNKDKLYRIVRVV